MIRMTLRALAGASLIVGAFWSLHAVDLGIAGLPSRSAEDINQLEIQYDLIEFELIREHATPERIGYVTERTLQGTPPDDNANLRWSQLRYLMIPRVLVRGTEAPYVIGDFKKGALVPAVPASLVEVYNSGNGMILYKRQQP
jgi:hypothetical protein